MNKNNKYGIAIIGGSGIEKIDNCRITGEFTVKTPFGKPSAKIQELTINSRKVLFFAQAWPGSYNSSGRNTAAGKYLGFKIIGS